MIYDAPVSLTSDKIQKRLQKDFKAEIPILVRTPAEWKKMAVANPFLKERGIDPTRLHVTLVGERLERSAAEKFEGVSSGDDRWALGDRVIYLHCPDGYGRTKLSNGFFEKRLKVVATTRNWNSVGALLQLSGC